MWMEERIGERINLNRTTEAIETGADQIAVGCPFCRVMLADGLTAKQAAGEARERVEVLDVAQLLLASVRRGDAATTDGADGRSLTVTTDVGANAGATPQEAASSEARNDPHPRPGRQEEYAKEQATGDAPVEGDSGP